MKGFERRKPSRQPFPEHLPRERVVIDAPTACACCGGWRLSKLGEDVTETRSLSTRADQVGGVTALMAPLFRRLEIHGFAAERLHADDTTVQILAKGQTYIGRIWTYVLDDAPFGGTGPRIALFYYSRDRKGLHPQGHLKNWSGVLQADAYGGYNKPYKEGRRPALSWRRAVGRTPDESSLFWPTLRPPS